MCFHRFRARFPSSKGALRLCTLSQFAAESLSMASTNLISGTEEWKCLRDHVTDVNKTHLRNFLEDEA